MQNLVTLHHVFGYNYNSGKYRGQYQEVKGSLFAVCIICGALEVYDRLDIYISSNEVGQPLVGCRKRAVTAARAV